MEYFIVSVFGHRKIFDLDKIEKKLRYIFKEIAKQNQLIEVLMGRNGAFDALQFARKRLKKSINLTED